MLKCPFCGFGNEDGALFCEQCKSDLSAVTPAIPPAEPIAPPPSAMPPAPPAQAAPAAQAATASPAAGGKSSIPVGAKPKLVVKRGQKIGMEFPIYPDANYVGRSDDKPVDIDLEDQEPPERVWCSRQHALINYDENAGNITLEDLNSSNGTYVNRERVYPGQPRQLFVNDTIQIGTVHLALKV